jgi:hypothetical protein
MIDHRWTTERDRGNSGGGFTLAISDPSGINGSHTSLMLPLARRIVHHCRFIVTTADAAGIRSAYQQGAAAIALPWTQPAMLPDLAAACNEALNYQVLLFAAAGNGTATTQFPAAHPGVFAVAAGRPDGSFDPLGSPQSGRIDIAMINSDRRSSGATVEAAAVAIQWLGYAAHLYRTGGRRDAFELWLRSQGHWNGGCYFPVWR